MSEQQEYFVSYVTVPDPDVARAIARGLVKEKLAARVNLVKHVTSVYEWKGEVVEEHDTMMVITSHYSHIGDVAAFVEKNQPFQVVYAKSS